MTATETVVDVLVHPSLGSIAQLEPVTDAGRDWINENVETESYQWMGGRLCIEPRHMDALIEGLSEAGLTVREP